MSNIQKGIRLFGSILCLVFLLFAATITAINSNNNTHLANLRPYPDPYINIVQQSKCLMGPLPAYGKVGYILRADGSTVEFKGVQEGFRYFLTQYFLAPRLLDKSTDHKWIIANLTHPEEMEKIPQILNAKLVKECGMDSAVFERISYP